MWSNQGSGSGYGDQGGGYLNTTANFDSPQVGGEKKTKQRAQNVIPCTVAQILGTQQVDDGYVIDNIELHQVTLVGIVRSVKESATRIEYQLDDMTGPFLDVRQFVDNDENTPDEFRVVAMRENMYIRVHGHIRSFQEKHSVAAFKVLPITDMNELTTHILEVLHAHLFLTKGGAATSGGGTGTQAAPQASYGGADIGGAGSYAGARPDQGLTPVQGQVHSIIASCMDEQGLSINLISERLRSVSQRAIRDAVEFLSSEGHIYSTIDDEHFKSTESM